MLLYKKRYKLNLDYFARSNISKLFTWIIDERNDKMFPYLIIHGSRFIIHTTCPPYNCCFNKSKVIVELIIYDELDQMIYTNHINPYKHTLSKINNSDTIIPHTKYKDFRSRIIYKIMNFPLGKLRVKNFKGSKVRVKEYNL